MLIEVLLIVGFIVLCMACIALFPIILMTPAAICELCFGGDHQQMRIDMEFHCMGYLMKPATIDYRDVDRLDLLTWILSPRKPKPVPAPRMGVMMKLSRSLS